MSHVPPFKPAAIGTLDSMPDLPLRGGLGKDEYRRLLAEEFRVFPGSTEYFRLAGEFMPLEVRLGVEAERAARVVWRSLQEMNPHMSVFGATGSGKTETLITICSEIVRHGIPVLILDLHGDVNVDHTNKVVLSSGAGSMVGVNPMSIEGLNPETHSLHNLRVELVAMLRRAAPTLSQKQAYILSEAMKTAYVAMGIEDWDPRTWRLQPPTFAHVKQVLDHWARDPEMKGQRDSINGCAAVLSAIFGDVVFHRQQVLSVTQLLSGNWRLLLNHLPEPVQVVVVDSVLRAVFRRLRAMGAIDSRDPHKVRLFVVIDEAKVIASGQGDPNRSGRILNLIATEGRKFGLGMILASQSREHFGADVLRNFGTRLVLRALDFSEARENAMDMQLSPEDLLGLQGRGDGYLKYAGSERPVRIQVTPVVP